MDGSTFNPTGEDDLAELRMAAAKARADQLARRAQEKARRASALGAIGSLAGGIGGAIIGGPAGAAAGAALGGALGGAAGGNASAPNPVSGLIQTGVALLPTSPGQTETKNTQNNQNSTSEKLALLLSLRRQNR